MTYTITPNGSYGYTVSVNNQTLRESNENTARLYDGQINGSLEHIFRDIQQIEEKHPIDRSQE